MIQNGISIAVLKRLPLYLRYLQNMTQGVPLNISASTLAANLKLGEVQVRKDLAMVSGGGRPRTGYVVEDLIADLQKFLGYDDVNNAVIVGAGKLGQALLDYEGFKDYGLHIVAAFDNDPNIVGENSVHKMILPMEKFPDICSRMGIKIGIITVPAPFAQGICNLMAACGINAIWNFAPVFITSDPNVFVQQENMAASLALLLQHSNAMQSAAEAEKS